MKALILLLTLAWGISAQASPFDGIWLGEGTLITSGGEYIECNYRFEFDQKGSQLYRYKTSVECGNETYEWGEVITRILADRLIYNGKNVGIIDKYGFNYKIPFEGNRVSFSFMLTADPGEARFTEFIETGRGTFTFTGILRDH